jgi:long-chain acyl-CoA synthetase
MPSPDALAVADADATLRLSYRELDERVARLARRIAGHELGPQARVALIGDNSAAHLMAALAIWRAGATLVTIYSSSTDAELEYALGHSQPSLVIAAPSVVAKVRRAIDGWRAPVVELTDVGDVLGLPDEHGDAALPEVDPDAPALICYTSGSTSTPKAVVHSHGGLASAAAAYADVWHLGPADVTLVSLPLAWAFGLVTTSMATLTAGGTVVLLARSDPASLLRSFSQHEVTFFAGVTTVFVKMVEALEADASLPRPASLRLCISGGEPRNEAAFERWRQQTGCPVHDVYAASECFPVVTYDPMRDPEPYPGVAGRVVPGAAMRVVDGEAWVRGPALMLGYLDDPELTASVLTSDGWYRTGDLVEVDSEGYVSVIGRLSDVIIRGGANVSPAEVEAVLVRHAAVREAAVVGLPDPVYGEQVAAAVVLEPEAETLDIAELLDHCTALLAAYKRPTVFVVVPELPRNTNTGKVQRRQVAALVAQQLATS